MKQQMGNENFQGHQGASKATWINQCFSRFSKAEPLCWEPNGIVVSDNSIQKPPFLPETWDF
jgi:hypothetical protein